ncbi:uncharacterized protein LOC107043511 [Diachasma alloeum]|uniref:uncharacterized protein LOC107043511 n=1 Tax=Diachasma alloeum TaxID=454923 RepID=UPI000738203D|nr:uncharacterized protein LOC107043511 [Diachasma alloeum]
MERTLNRWRQKTRPRKPRNLPDYTSLLSEDEWKRKYLVYKGGELSVTTIAAGASNFVTIYADRTLLSLLQPRQKLNIDATFAVCPSSPKVTQLLTVIGTINDEKVPIIWALMTKKNTQAYQAFFQYFKNHLAPNLQPHTFFVDFEQALTNVIREFYPNARIVHCFFHHIQALTKKLASLKGKKKIHRNMKICPRAKLFLRKIMALALLPFDRIEGAYQNLIADTDLDLRTYFASFLQYYEQYWIQQCRPENYSVYGLSKRTNNDIEAYHRTLWEKLGLKPDIWVFTAQLRSLLVEVKLKIAASNRGHRITRTTEHKYLVRQDILARIWELYEANELNDKKLLIASSHLIRAFGADGIMRTVHEVNNFINTEAYEDIVRLFPTLHRYTVDKQGPLVDGSLTVTRHQVHRFGCLSCNVQRLANHLCPECLAWYSCESCLARDNATARNLNALIMCSECRNIIEQFSRIHEEITL